MDFKNKATKIDLFNFTLPQMRTFHVTWFAFFLCFFGWFGIAPLMQVVREDLQLTKEQIGNTVIASVFITIFARLIIGPMCDRIGARLTYTYLLILGSFPVMLIGLSQNYTQFLLFRLAIGAIGASFVITQYHTTVMFAPNVVGTATATTAGWGNFGGGLTQVAMPLIFTAILSVVADKFLAWRLAMVIPGIGLFFAGIMYYFLTQDAPDGNYADLRGRNEMPAKKNTQGAFLEACKDSRVWSLFFIYAACFGIELTIDNTVALYFADYFHVEMIEAGMFAAVYGLMNIFARSLGGILSDKLNLRYGLRGRTIFLFVVILIEGVALIIFSRMASIGTAIFALAGFALFMKMSEGATYALVPYINKRALGSVAGIIGAGGNLGAVAAGFLFKGSMDWNNAYLILGIMVVVCSVFAFGVRFSESEEVTAKAELQARLAATSPTPVAASAD